MSRELCRDHLVLDMSDDCDRFFAEVDSFVALSQGNDYVRRVTLYPYDLGSRNYELWDKVGQGVGNLKSLDEFVICLYRNNTEAPDWETLARILPHIQNKITLRIDSGRIQGMRACELLLERFKVILLLGVSRI
jgi:hypothetical protein